MCIFAELLLFMSFGVSAYSNIVVLGNVDEDVILPCTIEYEEEYSFNTLFVRWKTKDIYVHHFYDGSFQERLQHEKFKGRTQLFYAEFPKGNLSLLLKNIKTFDAGMYECLAFISKVTYTMKTELVVRDKTYGFTNESSVVKVSVGVLILCVIMGLTACLRRKKKSRGKTEMPPEKRSQDSTPEKLKTN